MLPPLKLIFSKEEGSNQANKLNYTQLKPKLRATKETNKMQYIHTMGQDSGMKRGEVLICAIQHGQHLEAACEVKEARHERSHIVGFHLYEISGIGRFIQRKSRLVAVRGWQLGWGKWRVTANRSRVSFWSNENVLELESSDQYTTL